MPPLRIAGCIALLVAATSLVSCAREEALDDPAMDTTQEVSACNPLTVAAVSASGHDGNVPANAVDGSLATRWSAYGKGSFLTADLGSVRWLCGVRIAWFKGDTRSNAFTVSVSKDGTAFTQVFSGKSTGTMTTLEAYDFADVQARYLRVTVNGNTLNLWASITELAVTGNADLTRPTVRILSPAGGSSVVTGTVSFTGSASDSGGSGVEKVEIRREGGSYVKATPKAPGDWSSWSGSLSLPSGPQIVHAKVTDKAGNAAWHSIELGVSSPDAGLLDSDGVVMLFLPNPNGSSFSLGSRDPNTLLKEYFDLNGDSATQSSADGVAFWTVHGHKITYASGAPDGVTVRLNVKPSGGSQTYHWKNGALTAGYIGNSRDLKNLEATIYVRVREYNGTHTSMGWKIRGGTHGGSNDPRSSCTGMTVPYGGRSPGAYRELDHPNYDNVTLTPKFPYQLTEGKWLAVKMVSYVSRDEKSTQNFLYLDTDPFDAAGKPRNDFKLYTEWVDQDGMDTGRYTQAALWGGWINTFRIDGWKTVDFAIVSAREILPPE